jgi:hypothetical protein
MMHMAISECLLDSLIARIGEYRDPGSTVPEIERTNVVD